jgi:dihydroneopterin aldolase
MLILVSVQKYRAFLPIGWFEDEIRIKTEVFIDVEISYHVETIADDLNQTIDYSEIHQILRSLSHREFKLLETFGQIFLEEIAQRFQHIAIQSRRIRIHKPQILELGSDCELQFIEIQG